MKVSCISCGMPMQTINDHAPGNPESSWCVHCSAEDGSLQSFEERFERMVQWQMKKRGQTRNQAEVATREYMKQMPAWAHEEKLK